MTSSTGISHRHLKRMAEQLSVREPGKRQRLMRSPLAGAFALHTTNWDIAQRNAFGSFPIDPGFSRHSGCAALNTRVRAPVLSPTITAK